MVRLSAGSWHGLPLKTMWIFTDMNVLVQVPGTKVGELERGRHQAVGEDGDAGGGLGGGRCVVRVLHAG